MTFSFVIPTKNRPIELASVFDSILDQNHLPDQVIIIDQSSPENIIKDKMIPFAKKAGFILDYVIDEQIKGLVQAKATSIQYNICDYISFFDDDIVLEKHYLQKIQDVLIENPSIIGVNGHILNYPKVSRLKKFIFKITHIGLFKDDRIERQLQLNYNHKNKISLSVLSGGLSTWKKSVFERVKFDTHNNFHAYEDQEFSIRVKREFSNNLYLIPEAGLNHYHSEINRNTLINKFERDLIEVFKIYKKNNDKTGSLFSLLILLFGLLANAILLSVQERKIKIFINYFKGLSKGFKLSVRQGEK